MDERRQQSSKHAWAYLVLALAVAWSHWALRVYAMDDAYIHFRIADNLAQHGRPYYHLDEPLMASSSSAWTMLVAGVFLVFGAQPAAVAILNCAILVGGCMAWVAAVRQLTGRRDFVTDFGTTLIVVSCCFVSSVGLMETPLAMALLGTSFWLYQCGRAAAFAVAAAAVFVRFEAGAYLVVLLVLNGFERRVAWRAALPNALLGAAPFVVYGLSFFGTLIPQSVAAKDRVFQLTTLNFLSVAGKGVMIDDYGPTRRWMIVAWAAALAVCAIAAGVDWRRKNAAQRAKLPPALLAIAVMGAAVLSAYAVKRVLVFPWYVPLFTLPAFVALFALARIRGGRAVTALFAIAWLPTGLLLVQTCLGAATTPTLYSELATGARVRKYLEIGAELYGEHPDARLLTSEIGGLGFVFRGKILDGGALVSPDALAYHPMAVPQQRPNGLAGAIPAGYVRATRPDLIVSLDGFLTDFFQSDIADEYELRKEPIYIDEDRRYLRNRGIWGSTYLAVLTRKRP